MVLLVLFATTHTNIDPLHVLSTMAPKQDRIYARGLSKSVTLFAYMFIASDDERDPEYVPPGTSTPSCAARAPRATPKKVSSGVVTASQSDEERTLTGTPSRSATNEEGASGSLGVSWSVEASGFAEVPAPATPAVSASSMRLTVWNPHQAHQLWSLPQPLTSPTGGVSTGNSKSTPTPSS